MEDENTQDSEQHLELIDVADTALLGNGRPKPGRGRPPGSGNKARLLAGVAVGEPATGELNGNNLPAPRINGRPMRAGRAERGSPSRVNSDKPIFTLSVAAEILALHPRTLRIYEEHGLVVPHRTQTQRRRYSQNDIKKFQFIQFLTQRRRVNLEGVKIILSMLDELRKLGVAEPVKLVFEDYQEAD